MLRFGISGGFISSKKMVLRARTGEEILRDAGCFGPTQMVWFWDDEFFPANYKFSIRTLKGLSTRLKRRI